MRSDRRMKNFLLKGPEESRAAAEALKLWLGATTQSGAGDQGRGFQHVHERVSAGLVPSSHQKAMAENVVWTQHH